MKEKVIYLIGPMPVNFELINENEKTIFVDGGLLHKRDQKHSISVGDSDSTDLPHDIQLRPHKDRSDFYHALRAIPEGKSTIVCHGFTGGRFDHQLMIFGEAHHFLNHLNSSSQLHFYSEKGIYATFVGQGEYKFDFQGLFSLYSFVDADISLVGKIKYEYGEEYPKMLPANTSQGLSNVAHGKFKLSTNRPILLIYINA